MTTIEMLNNLEKYYGLEYNKMQRQALVKYFEGKNAMWLEASSMVIIEEFSGQYKSLPDIAVFKRNLNLIIDQYDRLEKLEANKRYNTKQIGGEVPLDPQEASMLLNAIIEKLTGRNK